MKQVKVIIVALILVVLLALLLHGFCGEEVMVEDLTGKWVTNGHSSRKSAASLLEKLDFCQEELAIVNLDSLEYVKYVEFTEDKEYKFYYDMEATKVCVREFFGGVLDSLFEKRAELNDVYGVEFEAMSREEFKQYYTAMYGFGDLETMLDTFSEQALNYIALAEFSEKGTYELEGPVIVCTITPEETVAETEDGQKAQENKDEKKPKEKGLVLGVAREGEYLVLSFADAIEKYTKVA